MREALRLLEERDTIKDIKLAALCNELQLGVDELDAGKSEALDMSAIIAKARALKAT